MVGTDRQQPMGRTVRVGFSKEVTQTLDPKGVGAQDMETRDGEKRGKGISTEGKGVSTTAIHGTHIYNIYKHKSRCRHT